MATAPILWTSRLARLLPLLLLVVSWLVGLSAAPPFGPQALPIPVPQPMLWIAVLVLRLGAEYALARWPRSVESHAPAWRVWCALHLTVTTVLILVNPFACIYAFVGYLDAERMMHGRWGAASVVVTGVIIAIGQSGGVPGIMALPSLFIGLLAVNVAIASAMMWLSRRRELEARQREEAAEQLAALHRRNLALQADLVDQARRAGVAAERSRLSREIHDTVAQGLVGVIAQLESVPDSADPAVRHRVDRAEESARDCLAEARRAVRALASPLLDEGDLVLALHGLVDRWSRDTGMIADLHVEGELPTTPPRADALLRVAQEALANVSRHADAERVRLTLTVHTDELRIDVRDDGQGFDPATVRRGHGLTGMAQRMAEAGGSWGLETMPGHGCTVSAAVPR